MRFCHLVIPLFCRCITVCKERKLCSRWHWLKYMWSDQWSWWITCHGSLYFLKVVNEKTCHSKLSAGVNEYVNVWLTWFIQFLSCHVWPHFKTPRWEMKTRCPAGYFWGFEVVRSYAVSSQLQLIQKYGEINREIKYKNIKNRYPNTVMFMISLV